MLIEKAGQSISYQHLTELTSTANITKEVTAAFRWFTVKWRVTWWHPAESPERVNCWVVAFSFQHQVVSCGQCPVGQQHLFTTELQEMWGLGRAAQSLLYLQGWLLDPVHWGAVIKTFLGLISMQDLMDYAS